MTLRSLDHYERRAAHDIRAWVAGERGMIGQLMDGVGATTARLGRPVGWVAGRVMRDPRVTNALNGAAERSLDGLSRFMTQATPAAGAVLAYDVADHHEIAGLHLREIDGGLQAVRDRHRAIIIALGAAEGVAGVAGPAGALIGFVASIPALQATSLRAVADLSRHAGFDPEDFGERQMIAEITLRTMEGGQRGRDEMARRLLGLGKQQPAARATDPAQKRAALLLLREQAQRAGLQLTRRRSAALLPVIGAAAGAGFNAAHAHRLLGGATMLFRARHLARTHDLDLADLLSPDLAEAASFQASDHAT